MKKKYRFDFWDGKNRESELFELDADLSEEEIDKIFTDWYFNQLDMAGIEGAWDEVSDD